MNDVLFYEMKKEQEQAIIFFPYLVERYRHFII